MSEQIKTKTCRTCKQTKPLTEFHKQRVKKDGHQDYCKSCRAEHQIKYRKTKEGKEVQNRYQQSEKFKYTQNRYIQSEKGKNTQESYRQSVKGQVALKRGRKRYEQSTKGKEVKLRNAKRYQIAHPEQNRARQVIRNAIRNGKMPRPDTLQCHYCPNKAKQYHHWHGYAPEHWLDVVPVCTKCHNKISNSHKALQIASPGSLETR